MMPAARIGQVMLFYSTMIRCSLLPKRFCAMRRHAMSVVLFGLVCFVSPHITVTAQDAAAGSALTSIFSPARAPQRKTMGLLQRSFLDIAAEGDQELEVAIVVDGTDSMTTELAGVRKSIHKMLSDLRKYRNNEVRAAIVVYRDFASPSGECVIPSKTFTADEAAIEKAVQTLQPESGAPYFHELPDLGLHKAINELQWSADDQVAKWILMFGDAPPYSESRAKQPEKKGRRRFATDVLIGAAKARGIRVHCVLCTSSENVSQSYDQAIDETRVFMNRISGGTDGLMLDLSYPQIRTALVDSAKQPELQYAEIHPITAIDLASVQRGSGEEKTEAKPVRVAVLPHVPLAQMRTVGNDPSNRAVQVSTALRTRLAQVAGVEVVSPVDIQRRLRRIRAGSGGDQQKLRELASWLRVDYVVWGQVAGAGAGATYQTAAYRRDSGRKVVQVDLPGGADQGTWTHIFLTAASNQGDDDEAIARLIKQIDANQATRSAMMAPMAESTATTGDLLEALEALEQALQYDTRSDQSSELLKRANLACEAAAKAEPRNALAHWLKANVAYNQAAHLFQLGETEAATKRMQEMKSSLRRAKNSRGSVLIPSLLTEIEADYLLLIEKDIPAAVEQYESLTQPDQPPASQLRGHWMLSGIHAGDWGNADRPNPQQARLHVMQVMSNWPDSPQATLLKRWLKYDETTQQTEFNYLPMVNVELSSI